MRAALRKNWIAGRARAAAVSPEQAATCPASLPGGCFCQLPALALETPLEQHSTVVGFGSHAAMGGARSAVSLAVVVAMPQRGAA